MTPIALTDAQLAAIQDLARLIPSWRRDEFLRELATRLRDVELGDGAVHRIAARCLKDVLARPRGPLDGGQRGGLLAASVLPPAECAGVSEPMGHSNKSAGARLVSQPPTLSMMFLYGVRHPQLPQPNKPISCD